MKKIGIIIIYFLLAACSSKTRYHVPPIYKTKINFSRYHISPIYKTKTNFSGYIERGIASWYGPTFHGKRTSSGEIYNMYDLTAAHKILPFNTKVLVINLYNHKKVIVRINDGGPFVKNRIIDLSYRAAQKIDMIKTGTAPVIIKVIQTNNSLETFFIQIGSFNNKKNAKHKRNRSCCIL